MISGHDFRSKRKANVHFIARELEMIGKTRFFSIGYSPISLIKREPRSSLWSRANKVEKFNGIDCFLWRTLWHPINLHRKWLLGLEKACFRSYAKKAPIVLQKWLKDSETIILESGMSVIFFDLIKEINPEAKIIYICSDALATIGCSDYLSEELCRVSPALDGIRIPSLKLASEFPLGTQLFYVPHGMDADNAAAITASPYESGVNLVSVGSMLFDPSFFEIAAKEFPHITFYVIGGGRKADKLSAPNIIVRGEMPYDETVAYLKYANAGIAPYIGEKVSTYLVDTSMKLMQFEAYGIPAICPYTAAGSKPYRFGYTPGSVDSIRMAINAALACGKFEGMNTLSWRAVTERILHPTRFADTRVELA